MSVPEPVLVSPPVLVVEMPLQVKLVLVLATLKVACSAELMVKFLFVLAVVPV